jgi:hypothetical protein
MVGTKAKALTAGCESPAVPFRIIAGWSYRRIGISIEGDRENKEITAFDGFIIIP